jgi:hypothetical protein
MAGATLNPLADALGRRYGMAVTILLAGPIPKKGGAIETLRYVTNSFDARWYLLYFDATAQTQGRQGDGRQRRGRRPTAQVLQP